MYKNIVHRVSRKATLVSLYLFAILCLGLYGHYGLQTFNQIILWGFGPVMAFYILEPNITRLNTVPNEYYLYLSMVFFSFLGYLNIEHEEGFFRYLQVFIANFVLMIMVYFAINNIKEWELAWKILCLVAVVVAIASFFVDAPLDPSDEYYRLQGVTGNANGTANYARVGVVSALILMQFTRLKLTRLILWGIVTFLGYTILLTASRGNFVNLIFIVGGYLSFQYFKGWRLVLFLIFLFLFGNLLLYLFENFLQGFYIFERFTRNDSVSDALDNEARFQLYTLTLDAIIQYPILGLGLGQFYYYAGNKISHTDILDIMVQLGIFAGLVYTYIYVKVLKKIFGLKKYFINKTDVKIFHILLICFISDMFYGFSNANWFTQLQMVILSLLIVYTVKIRNTSTTLPKES